MKKWKDVLILVFLGFTIYLCFRNYTLSREVNSLNHSLLSRKSIPDTVYIPKLFMPKSTYNQGVEPERVLIYRSSNSVSGYASAKPSQGFISSKDSLVQLLLKKDQLSLSMFNLETQTYSTRLFNLDLEKYDYNWYEGQLTQKKTKCSIKPYLYGKYRYFNNLWDMGTGISIKTKKFNYKLGINTFYYPRLKSGLGTDIEFQITYNF